MIILFVRYSSVVHENSVTTLNHEKIAVDLDKLVSCLNNLELCSYSDLISFLASQSPSCVLVCLL